MIRKFAKLSALAAVVSGLAVSPAHSLNGIGAGGIPGLILTTDMVTNFSDFSAAYLNPALITGIDQAELNFGASSAHEIWNPKYASVSVPFGLDHSAAVTIMQVGLSNVPRTNLKGERIDGWVRASEIVMQGSYGYKILPFLSVGSNMTLIQPSVDQDNVWGFTFDLGVRAHPIEDYLLGKFSLGLNLQNVFYKDFSRASGDEFNKYPLNIHLQGHWYNEYYRPFLERIEMSFNVAVMDLITEAKSFGDPANVQNIQNPDSALAVVGQKFKNISIVYGLHGKWFPFKFFGLRSGINTNGVIPIGISLNWKRINVIKYAQIDYDFGLSTEKNLPDPSQFNHTIKLGLRFGPTREEAVSERWYRQLMAEPMNDFNEAMRLYLAKKYWLASFAFGKVLAKWPSFSKVDIATFYMGKSYEYLHMNDVARETYTRGLKKYTTSDFRPKFIYQLQNLDYKLNDYDNALRNYGFIMNLYRDSDISPDADYIAGQIYYNKKDFQGAINVLSAIEKDNENYMYAQYTLAMIAVHRKNFDEAIEKLSGVIGVDSVKTVSEKSLRELAFVKLGHVYFEMGDLKNAYGAYKQVSAGSRFYDEALLGLAWTYVRGGVDQSYTLAIQTADNLVSARPKSQYVAESYLVMGYAQTLLKNYQKSVDAYKKVIEICDAKYISRQEMKQREDDHNQKMTEYVPFQKGALNIALRKPSPALLEQKEKMTPDWVKFDGEIREYSAFAIEADQQFAFKKSAEKLKKDAEYALATTLHLMDSEKKQQIIDKTREKTKGAEKEMEQLQKELQEIEQ